MSDWSLPQLTSLYADVLTNIGGRLDDATKMNRTGGGTVASAVTLTNPPVGTVRWNSTSKLWEANTGTGATASVPVWEALSADYGITVAKAGQWTTTRTITLTGDATASATNIDGSANVSIATALASVVTAQGPTGSATAVPVITIDAKGRVTAMSTAALGSIATQAANSVAITGGAISGTALTLEQSTTFAQTAEGRMGWDTDDDVITVGTGAATKVFAPLAPTNAVTATNYTFSTSCNWNGNAVPVLYGGTGATTAAGARTNLGLGDLSTANANAVAITGGSIAGASLTLVQSTTAAPTAEGRVEWDTDDDVLVVGTGAATKVFAPLSPTNAVTMTNHTFSTSCVWNGTAVPVLYGGTGATTAAGARTNLGAVGSVTASAPLVMSGGTADAPNVTITQATTTTNGYLSSTDWNTFNGKQAALSTASSTVSGILSSTDWSTFNGKQAALSTASSTVSGILSSTDWSTFNGKQAALGTTSNMQFNSIGVGTAAAGTAGDIRATGNVTAYYSDGRLKDYISGLSGALAAVESLEGFRYRANATAARYGFNPNKVEIGLRTQDVAKIAPELLSPAPFDIGKNEDGSEFSRSGENYMTMDYERLVPYLVEAIKELSAKVRALEAA